jgi:hypothetical protein
LLAAIDCAPIIESRFVARQGVEFWTGGFGSIDSKITQVAGFLNFGIWLF